MSFPFTRSQLFSSLTDVRSQSCSLVGLFQVWPCDLITSALCDLLSPWRHTPVDILTPGEPVGLIKDKHGRTCCLISWKGQSDLLFLTQPCMGRSAGRSCFEDYTLVTVICILNKFFYLASCTMLTRLNMRAWYDMMKLLGMKTAKNNLNCACKLRDSDIS